MDKNKQIEKQLHDLIMEGAGGSVVPGAKVAAEHTNTAKEEAANTKVHSERNNTVLTVIHESKLLYKGRNNNYYILGELPMDMGSLKVLLLVTEDSSDKRDRYKIDLYEREQCRATAMDIANLFHIHENEALRELLVLTDLLEQYRDNLVQNQQTQHRTGKPQRPVSGLNEKEAIGFLTKPGLMQRIDKLLEQAGIQDSHRVLLYLIGASYKSTVPLHIGITGNSNTVKNLIDLTAQCLPTEDTLLLNQVSAKSFYHSTNGTLENKVMLLPNGVDKKTQEALSLLQQGDKLVTATTVKDKLSNMVSAVKTVSGHFSSIMYLPTSDANGSNLIITNIGLQADKNIEYYNKKIAGLIDESEEQKAKGLLQDIVRMIKPLQVINPHAHKINIPVPEDSKAQVNQLFQNLIMQVCLMHQYQRNQNLDNRLIAEIEDIRIATELLFDSMVLNNDQLDTPALRFYERVKTFVKQKAGDKKEEYCFTMQELRSELSYSGSGAFRCISKLYKLHYIEREGYANRGFKYKITWWEDTDKYRKEIKDNIMAQLELLGLPNEKQGLGKPRSKRTKGLTVGLPIFENNTYSLNERAHTYEGKTDSYNKKKPEPDTEK